MLGYVFKQLVQSDRIQWFRFVIIWIEPSLVPIVNRISQFVGNDFFFIFFVSGERVWTLKEITSSSLIISNEFM